MWGVHRWVQNNSYLHALGATHDHCYITDTIAITVTTDITVVPMICLCAITTAIPLLPLLHTAATAITGTTAINAVCTSLGSNESNRAVSEDSLMHRQGNPRNKRNQ
jgi:hypothetical protein